MSLSLEWEDEDGNRAWVATESMKSFKVVSKWWVEVSSSVSKKTIALREANSNIATFVIKPSNDSDEIQLENLIIRVKDGSNDNIDPALYRVKVDSVEQFDPEAKTVDARAWYEFNVNENIPSKGLEVTVDLKDETSWTFTVEVLQVNNKVYTANNKVYVKQFVAGVARIAKQEDLDGTTKFTLAIDGKADSSYSISDFCVYDSDTTIDDTTKLWCKDGEFEDGDTFEAVGTGAVKMIKAIEYKVNWATSPDNTVTVKYSTMPDYFKVSGNDARVYKVKN